MTRNAAAYRMCTRCVMDTSDPDIRFDEQGVCNHCHEYAERAARTLLPYAERKPALDAIVERIKAKTAGKDYDCVLGLSGGVDSSYVAYLAKQLGLRPLVVHFDNGWNAELAVSNIENIVKKLGFDLITYVIDWEEFRDLQLAFFRASVVDIELLTDHAITASLYKIADEHGIGYILSGTNTTTEGIMPRAWFHYLKYDLANIKAIHKRYGHLPLKRFPTASLWKILYMRYVKGIRTFSPLNYIDYRKKEAIGVLEKELDWRDYGGKHYESVFTRFYQAYILPEKFNIDKRRAHYSALINSGQLERAEALEQLQWEPYGADLREQDKAFVLKKLGMSATDFDQYIKSPPRSHLEFGSSVPVVDVLRKVRGALGLRRLNG